jgi:hypothetical protein
MAKLSPIGNNAQFINGIPAAGAKLFTYAAGSSTKQTTYTDEAGTIPQTNPIILDARGEPAQPIWLTEGLSYKFVFAASTDSDPPTSPIWDVDDVTGINDASVTIEQWIDSGVTPTYVSATSFTLPGDRTSAFTVGRRVKVLVTAGTAYGTITASVFAALTTVTVLMDSTPLDSGLSSVQLGLITPTNTSFPGSALVGTPVQRQTYTAFTTGGTSAAFSLTPIPAITANATSTRFNVIFNATPSGNPTLAVSGQTAKNLKYYDATGNKQFVTSSQVISGWVSDVVDDGTDWVVMRTLLAPNSKLIPITATVAGNDLTISLPSTSLDFRSVTLPDGTVLVRGNASTLTLVVPNTATLGTANNVSARLVVVAMVAGGVIDQLAVINASNGYNFDESTLITTTAISTASDSANVFYSTSARNNFAFRIVGFIDITEATAGTWATNPTLVQGAGGAASVSIANNAPGAAPMFACRAWVKFNGTGTPSILGSGNVSSITDNGVGDYTINFTTPLPDANYAPTFGIVRDAATSVGGVNVSPNTAPTASALRIETYRMDTRAQADFANITVAIFR